MIINIENLDLMNGVDGKLHDSRVISFNYDLLTKKMSLIILSALGEKIYLDFENVQGLVLSYDFDMITENDVIFGWESIPNTVIKDNYLFEVKERFINNKGEWNEALFAVRFLFVNMGELKIVCEQISVVVLNNF
jgi:hypothetical protein